MFNILFWNLKGHAIEDYVIECIAENDVDIVLFSEFAGIDQEGHDRLYYSEGLEPIGKRLYGSAAVCPTPVP